MSGQLEHTPSQIIRKLLIDLSLGSDHGANWPVQCEFQRDKPDKAIAVYETAGINLKRIMIDGEWHETYGIQIIVRSDELQLGREKASDVATALDGVALQVVNVEDTESYGTATSTTGYTVHNVSRRSGPIPLNDTTSNRKMYSINYLVNLDLRS